MSDNEKVTARELLAPGLIYKKGRHPAGVVYALCVSMDEINDHVTGRLMRRLEVDAIVERGTVEAASWECVSSPAAQKFAEETFGRWSPADEKTKKKGGK